MTPSFRRSRAARATLAAIAALGIGAFAVNANATANAATAGSASAFARCNSWALLGWKPGNMIYGGGWISCFRPFPDLGLTVDVTLYRNRTQVAYNRHDCFGTGDHFTCSVNSPAVKNIKGYQKWCAVSTANYGGLYKKTSRVCWRG